MKLGLPPARWKPASVMRADWTEADLPPNVPTASHSAAERWPAVRSPVVRSPVVRSPVVRSPVVRSPVVRSPVVRSPESAVKESAVKESGLKESGLKESGLKVCAVARDAAKSGAPRARHFEESAVTATCPPKGARKLRLASGSAWSSAETKR